MYKMTEQHFSAATNIFVGIIGILILLETACGISKVNFPKAQTTQQRWQHFQTQHVAHETGTGGWNLRQWNSWLQQRLGDRYGQKKPTNSAIVASAYIVQSSYPGAHQRDNLYYSTRGFTVYTFRWRSSQYIGIRCSDRSVLAGLQEDNDNRKIYPVHYESMNGTEAACVSVR